MWGPVVAAAVSDPGPNATDWLTGIGTVATAVLAVIGTVVSILAAHAARAETQRETAARESADARAEQAEKALADERQAVDLRWRIGQLRELVVQAGRAQLGFTTWEGTPSGSNNGQSERYKAEAILALSAMPDQWLRLHRERIGGFPGDPAANGEWANYRTQHPQQAVLQRELREALRQLRRGKLEPPPMASTGSGEQMDEPGLTI
jgi:hypothetical protein